MARNNSFIRLDGTLDGLTFYRKNGENLVKTQSRISKDRIMKDPSFRRTRENMMEFAGASKAGKAFRDAFANMVKLMGDTYISARLSGVMKRINSTGAGKRGERSMRPRQSLCFYFELLPEWLHQNRPHRLHQTIVPGWHHYRHHHP